MLAGGVTHEAVVDLEAERLASFDAVPGVHAAITGDEYAESEVAVKADAGFRAALALRGVHDLELVMVDTWSVGMFEDGSRRVGRALSWLRSDLTGDNGYARPIGGLLALVDLATMEVIRIDDHGVAAGARGARRLPRRRRSALSRRSAADRGRAARGLEPRARRPRAELGAVARARGLQSARVADAARARIRRGRRLGRAPDRPPALDRRARDPVRRHESDRRLQERVRHRRVRPRAVSNSLALGCDCLGEIPYLDAVMHDSRGSRTIATRSACTRRTRGSSGSTSTGAAARPTCAARAGS